MTETTAAIEAPTKRKNRTFRHLTTSDKAKLFSLWRQGEMTVDQLAKLFKKDRSTILRLFKDNGVVKGSDKKAVEERVQEQVQRQIVDDASVIAGRIRDTKDEHYKMANGIAKLTWKVIVDAQQAKKPMASVSGDLKALKAAAETLRIAREERYAVLGIVEGDQGDDGDLPTLAVTELTAKDIKEMNRRAALQAADELGIAALNVDEDELLDSEGEDGEINQRVETD